MENIRRYARKRLRQTKTCLRRELRTGFGRGRFMELRDGVFSLEGDNGVTIVVKYDRENSRSGCFREDIRVYYDSSNGDVHPMTLDRLAGQGFTF